MSGATYPKKESGIYNFPLMETITKKDAENTRYIELNVGPHHPATHGVLRLKLTLDGERVVKCEARIGYLHRGTEKTVEHKSYHQALIYTDRLDYLSPLTNNWAYVRAVEKLLGIEGKLPKRAEYLRVITGELSRISSHIVGVGTHVLDLGAWTFFLHAFREREKIYDLLEELTGQRMNNTYFRIGGVAADAPDGWLEKVYRWADEFEKKHHPELMELIAANPIFVERTRGIGVISPEMALSLGLTGPMIRGSGIKTDLRKDEPYSVYSEFDFEIPTGKNGDTYDRFMVRMEEMRQSVRIIKQAIERIPDGDVLIDDYKIVPPPKRDAYTQIEKLIHHFKLVSEGVRVPPGEAYGAVEAPKGELGFYIVSDGSAKPYRFRIRPPSFINLQSIEHIAPGHLIADIIALIGTIDIVLGEVDR